MKDRLLLDGVGILPQGRTVSFGLGPGQSVVLVGRAASGKTRMLRTLCGFERPAQGQVRVQADVAPAQDSFPRRATPESVARAASGPKRMNEATMALTALGLWDVRSAQVSSLSEGQQAACRLLAPLASPAQLISLDGDLDHLDPWTLAEALDVLAGRLRDGAALVAATNRPELLAYFDLVLILQNQSVLFAGSPEELLRAAGAVTLEVETRSQVGVRSLLDPFSVSVSSTETGLRIQAEEGSAAAARLLVEGYGDVKAIVSRAPTFEEAVRHQTVRTR